MTTLVLVRHAKSDWGDPGLDDHDRPLNSRSLRDAPAAARRLAATGLRLDALRRLMPAAQAYQPPYQGPGP